MATSKKPAKKAKPVEEWTEKKILVWLRSALRSASRRYPPLYAALAAAKEPYTVQPGEAGYNPRQRFSYRCAECDGLFPAKGVAVDHRTPCGSLLQWSDVQGFASRLFCQEHELDVLCDDCHSLKTLMESNGMTKEQAVVHQKVIAVEKKTVAEVVALLVKEGYTEHSNADRRRKSLTELFTKKVKEKEDGQV